jgi:hypothetical protein
VMVFLGVIMGQNMDLIFSPLELIAIVMAVYLTRNLIYDGESSWLEGLILIAVYVMFGIGFFHHPKTDPPNPLIALPAAVAQPRSTPDRNYDLPAEISPLTCLDAQ